MDEAATEIVTIWLAEPVGPRQVTVYLVVAFRLGVVMVPDVPETPAGEEEQEVLLVDAQVMTDVPPVLGSKAGVAYAATVVVMVGPLPTSTLPPPHDARLRSTSTVNRPSRTLELTTALVDMIVLIEKIHLA